MDNIQARRFERDPDAFFGRTTEILNVHVESTDVRTEDHFPVA